MNFVQPIRDKRKLADILSYLKKENKRDHMLVFLGINTGLRIKDILHLKVKDVKGHHISLREFKTKKQKMTRLTPSLYKEIQLYIKGMEDDEYLFKSRNGLNKPLHRTTAYRMIRKTGEMFGLKEVGCHTLRKTFGYHYYQKTKNIAMLQTMFNHDQPTTTLLYIGMTQDYQDQEMMKFDILA